MKLVVFPSIVILIVYETFFFPKVRAGIVTRPDFDTLIFHKEIDFPLAPTNDTVPDADLLKPVTTIRVGTSTGI